jgi:pimeloyl-ACP methyl ester carboxylesterase
MRFANSAKQFACVLLLAAVMSATLALGDEQQTLTVTQSEDAVPQGFVSRTADVGATKLHYVMGGQGPALVLLHGFPENWSAYARLMPALAQHFRVVALDLRGIGASGTPQSGYDSATMAEDVHALAVKLGLQHVYVVGHDFGGIVAYALARLHPDTVRGAMIIDVPLPGVDPWDTIKVDPRLWHFGFHRAPGIAEQLIAGREAIYFGYFMRRSAADPQSISDTDIDRYARAYSGPERLAAAMAMYRAFDADEMFGRSHHASLAVPVTLLGGSNSFATQLPAMKLGLERVGVKRVAVETVAGAGHYVIDEQPLKVVALIERHAAEE